MPNDNIIYVGKKPIMAYVTACITCLNDRQQHGLVTIAARGQSISRVVDVIEVLKRFVNYEIDEVKFATDLVDSEGEQRKISSMKVTLKNIR